MWGPVTDREIHQIPGAVGANAPGIWWVTRTGTVVQNVNGRRNSRFYG